MAILRISSDYNELAKLREKYSKERIIFCSGTFDLTHAGHVLFLEDCKKLGDLLVVGVGDDSTIQRYKGKDRPFQKEEVRLKMIDSLKPVDYAFIQNAPINPEDILGTLEPILSKLKPNFYAVNEDALDIEKRSRLTKSLDVQLVVMKRTCPKEFDEISTTKIIEKIRKNNII